MTYNKAICNRKLSSSPSVSLKFNNMRISHNAAKLFNALSVLILISTTQAARFARSESRIVDGVNVTPVNKYPMIVSIKLSGRHSCGGTILNKHFVLTAAHCAKYLDPATDNITVLAGVYHVRTPDPEHVQIVTVTKVHFHLKFSDETKGFYANDIAVLRVSPPFIWNDYVAPTNLPAPGWTVLNNKEMKAIAVGWGLGRNRTWPHRPTRPLQEVELPLLTTEGCQRGWLDLPVTDDQVCIEALGGAGSCHGDSGGPLFIYNEADDKHIQIGVTSWGENDCGNTTVINPPVWTKVSSFIFWIREATRECDPPRYSGMRVRS